MSAKIKINWLTLAGGFAPQTYTMVDLSTYIKEWKEYFPDVSGLPWEIVSDIQAIVTQTISKVDDQYEIRDGAAIHRSAILEEGVILKGPILISPGCFVGAHAYLRGGVFLGHGTSVGPGCEVKSSFILRHSALAHFNFVGDSIVGSDVNLEAGAVVANHYNERKIKTIDVIAGGKRMPTGVVKFGSVIGDHTRVGANAVLSPGTILNRRSVVGRLALVDQIGNQ